MILYFVIMWSSAFGLMYWLARWGNNSRAFGYKMAVVQAFTAASNNFVGGFTSSLYVAHEVFHRSLR